MVAQGLNRCHQTIQGRVTSYLWLQRTGHILRYYRLRQQLEEGVRLLDGGEILPLEESPDLREMLVHQTAIRQGRQGYGGRS